MLLSISHYGHSQQITIKHGDTLWGLALRHGTTVEAILQTNGLTGNDLIPGAVLNLPADSIAEPQTYTVQRGDTLFDIAVAFNTTVDELIAINNLDGSWLRVGQILRVHQSASLPPPEPLMVTVNPGDSLSHIAQTHETTVAAIVSANSLPSTLLQPGQQLRIPGRYASTSTGDIGGVAHPTITVARGESLWDISRRHDTTIAAIMSANNLSSTVLREGQRLRIIPENELGRALPAPETPPSQSGLIWPLKGIVTSRFGYRRLRVAGSNYHYGVDIDGNTGDPIVAAAPGTVVFSGWRSSYGYLVIIDTGSHEHLYAHASELLVAAGQRVETGQLIARVGSTGYSTGPHLHFEVRVDGSPIDPLPLLDSTYASP